MTERKTSITSEISGLRIVIVDDDLKYASCLRQVLESLGSFEFVGTFRNSVKFLSEFQKLEMDLVFLDVEMPKIMGVDCVNEIRQFKSQVKIIMISIYDDDDYVLRAFANGADGYLLKDSKPSQILEGIWDTLGGGACMSSSVARVVVDRFKTSTTRKRGENNRRVKRLFKLTDREIEVLELLSNGKTYGECALDLVITRETVKFHIKHIYEKMHAANRTEAVVRFLSGR